MADTAPAGEARRELRSDLLTGIWLIVMLTSIAAAGWLLIWTCLCWITLDISAACARFGFQLFAPTWLKRTQTQAMAATDPSNSSEYTYTRDTDWEEQQVNCLHSVFDGLSMGICGMQPPDAELGPASKSVAWSVASMLLLTTAFTRQGVLHSHSALSCGTQVAEATLQQLHEQQQQSGSSMTAAAPQSAPPHLAWPGFEHPIYMHNLPEAEKEHTVVVQGVRYLKLEELGSGGSSEVFKVVSPLNKVLAVKRVHLAGMSVRCASGCIAETSYLHRLAQEPTIIRLVASEVLWPRGVLYLVQESGDTDLQSLLEERHAAHTAGSATAHLAFGDTYLRLCWRQMVEGVHTIHKQGIVHRDLKPANFVLVNGRIKLIDFGIAKQLPMGAEFVECSGAGTIAYSAPEALTPSSRAGYVKIGKPSDVWSMGCILYCMVYGRQPFAHLRTNKAIMRAICSRRHTVDYPALPDAEVLDVIKRCLDRNPDTRATVQELLLHPFLNPVPVVHNTSGPPTARSLSGPYRPF